MDHDYTNLISKGKIKHMAILQDNINEGMTLVCNWAVSNSLILNDERTKIILLGSAYNI